MYTMAVKSITGDFYGTITDGVFIKRLRGSRHMLRKPPAWALDSETFDKIIRPSCKELRIIDTEANKTYAITTERFIKCRGEISHKGYGRQYFVILEHWACLRQ